MSDNPMIDPTELSGLCEQLRKRLRYYREDLNQVYIDCVEVATLDAVLDENAALRERVTKAEAERDTFSAHVDRVEDENTALESRLAALKEAGEKVVEWGERVQEVTNAFVARQGIPARAKDPELDAFKALLRSDP